MFSAGTNITIPERKRGPKAFFDDRKLLDLVAYFMEPDATLAGAAERFGCSDSLIEKTIRKIRRQAQKGGAA